MTLRDSHWWSSKKECREAVHAASRLRISFEPEGPMRRISVVALITFAAAIGAAGKSQPLNVKLGLWEVTTTITTASDLPIPAGLLERLSPEQRARVEERMEARKGDSGKTTVRKQCLTREQLDHGIPFAQHKKSCIRTVLTSSATKLEMRVKCVDQGINSDETFHIEAVTFESVKGSFDVSPTEGGDNTTKSNSTFTARWIGPLCTPTK